MRPDIVSQRSPPSPTLRSAAPTRSCVRSANAACSASGGALARQSCPNYMYNNLKQIVQTPTQVMILNEMVHDVRVVRIGGKHLPSHMRKLLGDSIGHWEGDTLVVETTNFTNKTRFRGSSEPASVSWSGSGASRCRFAPVPVHRRGPDHVAAAMDGESTWATTEEKMYESACHENNYALGGILRGHGRRTRESGVTDGNEALGRCSGSRGSWLATLLASQSWACCRSGTVEARILRTSQYGPTISSPDEGRIGGQGGPRWTCHSQRTRVGNRYVRSWSSQPAIPLAASARSGDAEHHFWWGDVSDGDHPASRAGHHHL